MKKFKKLLEIIERHNPDEDPIIAAEHDVIYLSLSLELVPYSSEDGKKLQRLGCSKCDNNEMWIKYV